MCFKPIGYEELFITAVWAVLAVVLPWMSTKISEPGSHAVFRIAKKLFVTAAWVVLIAVLPVIVAGLIRYPPVLLPVFWFLIAILTVPSYARALGEVEGVDPLPPAERALHHLPPACVRMVVETESICTDLDDLDQAFMRAWKLAQELECAPADTRDFLERTGATLEPVHELLRLRSETRRKKRLTDAQLRERLALVLTSFADTLVNPSTSAFR